jgi:hypothetical protein
MVPVARARPSGESSVRRSPLVKTSALWIPIGLLMALCSSVNCGPRMARDDAFAERRANVTAVRSASR